MGLMLSICALDAGFGLAMKSLSCLCCVLPWGRSTGARFLTAAVFFTFTFIAFTIHSWITRPIPYPPIVDVICGEEGYRFYSVYRIVLAMSFGYGIQSLLLLGVKDSRNPRSIVQDGFWPLKLAGFAGLVAFAFWKVPRSWLDYMYVPACILSSLFLAAQSVLLVDFAYNLAEWLMERAEEVVEGFNWYFAALLTITFGSLGLALGGTIFLMFRYPSSTNDLLNILNLFIIGMMNICSVLNVVREANPSAGLFQSSMLSVYVVFLLASALIDTTGLMSASQTKSKFTDAVSFSAIAATLMSVAYSAYSTGRNSHKLTSTSATLPSATDDDEEVTEYNYPLYQFVFVCASLYTGLLITSWKRPTVVDGVLHLVDARLSFWVKVATSWLVAALYIWSLFAPVLLTERDFYF